MYLSNKNLCLMLLKILLQKLIGNILSRLYYDSIFTEKIFYRFKLSNAQNFKRYNSKNVLKQIILVININILFCIHNFKKNLKSCLIILSQKICTMHFVIFILKLKNVKLSFLIYFYLNFCHMSNLNNNQNFISHRFTTFDQNFMQLAKMKNILDSKEHNILISISNDFSANLYIFQHQIIQDWILILQNKTVWENHIEYTNKKIRVIKMIKIKLEKDDKILLETLSDFENTFEEIIKAFKNSKQKFTKEQHQFLNREFNNTDFEICLDFYKKILHANDFLFVYKLIYNAEFKFFHQNYNNCMNLSISVFSFEYLFCIEKISMPVAFCVLVRLMITYLSFYSFLENSEYKCYNASMTIVDKNIISIFKKTDYSLEIYNQYNKIMLSQMREFTETFAQIYDNSVQKHKKY